MYVSFSDGGDVHKLIIKMSGAEAWMEADEESRSEGEEPKTYTVTPVWMTPEEFEKLPEAEY